MLALANLLLTNQFMKPFIFTLIFSTLFICNYFAQVEKVQFELEKTSFKMSLNSGLYKSRLSGSSEKENSFRNFSIFAQVYFPFKRSLDKPESFNQSTKDSNFFDRLFTTSPVAVFHLTEKGGNAIGMGQELSFKIAKKTFLKSQIAVVWVESNSQRNDGLQSGLNFHHFWHFCSYINSKTYLSIGYNHISNGKIFSKEVGCLFDMVVVGIAHSFTK
jgi:hypothetical protein